MSILIFDRNFIFLWVKELLFKRKNYLYSQLVKQDLLLKYLLPILLHTIHPESPETRPAVGVQFYHKRCLVKKAFFGSTTALRQRISIRFLSIASF